MWRSSQVALGRSALFASSALLLGKVIPYNLADIGEGILKARVTNWNVAVGDKINKFDNLCTAETDKATVPIPSLYTGIVKKLYVPEGGDLYVGKPVIDIEIDGDAEPVKAKAEPAATKPEAPAPVAASDTTRSANAGEKALATPAVRRLTKEHGININDVQATGKGGRVTKEDVLLFMESASGAKSSPQSTTPSTSAPSARYVSPKPQDRVEEITGIRKAMVNSMTQALKIPAFGCSDEIRVDNLIKMRKELQALSEARGIKLTYLPFFMKAASIALKEFPIINSTANEDCTKLTYIGSHNIGFAVDSAQGLLVPNVKNCEDKSVFEIAQEVLRISKDGKDGRVSLEDINGGTFTLSSIGNIGGTYTNPVIFPPQVAIGALGSFQTKVAVGKRGRAIPTQVVNVSWSADHRVIDGATMVRFGNTFKQCVESPARMLFDLR